MSRITRIAVAVVVLLGLGAPLSAQTIFGVRGGVSNDPKQAFGGFQMEWTALPPHTNLSFRPDVEVGGGSGVTLVTADFSFAYWVTLSNRWHAYIGAGPALVYAHQGSGCTDTELAEGCGGGEGSVAGSFSFMVGFQNTKGLFVELKTSGGAAPGLRVSVGFILKGRK